jgi:hypothetical protein
MNQSRAQTTRNIKKQKLGTTPNTFQHGTKRNQGKHIEKQVHESAVHKHVREKLPRTEAIIFEKMQGKIIGGVNQWNTPQKENNIDD